MTKLGKLNKEQQKTLADYFEVQQGTIHKWMYTEAPESKMKQIQKILNSMGRGISFQHEAPEVCNKWCKPTWIDMNQFKTD